MRSFYSHLVAPLTTAALAAAANPTISLKSFPNVLNLTADFDPIKEAYWTGLPHHRRTPFAVSPTARLATSPTSMPPAQTSTCSTSTPRP